ncbi:hypothetical protein X777_08176, partial [Ooceraea biroi]
RTEAAETATLVLPTVHLAHARCNKCGDYVCVTARSIYESKNSGRARHEPLFCTNQALLSYARCTVREALAI